MTLRGRLSRLEVRQGRAVSLWEALPEHLRKDVMPEDLAAAARHAPEALRGDVRALSLWAYLCGGEA
ncbi:hypothetical protein [Deinococcus sp. YIM 77859]|uniref:hypothetical protein n=1 Tax=Deinococcus sp. YIM 77859 TaxID=1540221 RepID=UPI000AF08CA3|nr:hypothetical protein [Deinococcus sp. YIM 77859]